MTAHEPEPAPPVLETYVIAGVRRQVIVGSVQIIRDSIQERTE